MKKPVIIDFETEGIQVRPLYPPKPVGVAIKYPGKKARYYAWGHPTKNNCTFEEGRAALSKAWDEITVQHNSKFDLDVASVHMNLPWPEPSRFHDTMLLAYLDDPHNRDIHLKSLSVQLLGRDPTERDEVREWVLANVEGAKLSTWGAHIAKAPGDLVGRYACADVEMTGEILDVLLARVIKAGMVDAYLREKALLRVLVGMEERGIPIDRKALHKDYLEYKEILKLCDEWIYKYLGITGDFNIDSKDELADALDASGKASNWRLTPTGKRSTSKDSIREAITDQLLTLMLDYRSTLANYIRNFMDPWDRVSQVTGGVIYTQWHSTKQEEGGGSRTGRLSSTPNLQNVPSDERWVEANLRFVDLYAELEWLRELPHIRNYIIAGAGHTILDRDYSQQEPRVLAHFEDGLLCAAYQSDPRMDIYIYGIQVVEEMTGVKLHEDPKFARKIMKTIILAIMYGLGLGRLAEKLYITVDQAKMFKAAIMRALPGIKMLTTDLNRRGQNREPMVTWGGRRYFAEAPKIVNGKLREFSYKLTNYLIQGSSADITKEAMIRYDRAKQHGELLITVHDQLLVRCPTKHKKTEMDILRLAMDSVELDAPLVSDGMWGTQWGNLKDCK